MTDLAASSLHQAHTADEATAITRGFVAQIACLLAVSVFYALAFCALTYPAILRFSTHFFCDGGDGLRGVWSIWWVAKAVTQLHQLPWTTSYLFAPLGTSLLGFDLSPFNGLLAACLRGVLTPIQTFNAIVMFSFVVGGVMQCLLAYEVTGSWRGSLAAGYLFTFSSYHFAHAEGHLQLVALEWVPLFVLCWYRFIRRPCGRRAIAVVVTLNLVALCSYYYLFYSALAAVIMAVGYSVAQRKPLLLFSREYRVPLLMVLIGVSLTSGLLISALLRLDMSDPINKTHAAASFPLDLLAPFIPGGHWRFANSTAWYWSQLPENIHEESVQLGVTFMALVAYAWMQNRRRRINDFWIWPVLGAVFWMLSLGPVLQVWGKPISGSILPYAWIERLAPALRLSGDPVRMFFMVTFSGSILCAAGLEGLFREGRYRLALAAIALMVIETLPRAIPTTRVTTPAYIAALKQLPPGATTVFPEREPPQYALYYQTIHQRPLAFRKAMVRVPRSVKLRVRAIRQLVDDGQYRQLCAEYGIGYIIRMACAPLPDGDIPTRVRYQDSRAIIYEFEGASACHASK